MSKQQPPLTIRIGAVGDPPLFPGIMSTATGECFAVGILEKGMASGATSVSLHIVTDNGSIIFVEMSAGMVSGIAGAVAGAVRRFEGGHGNN